MPFRKWVYRNEDLGKWIGEVHRIGSNEPTTGRKVWWGAFDTKGEAEAKAKETKEAEEAEEAEEEKE